MATWYPGVGNLPPAQYNKKPSTIPTGGNNTTSIYANAAGNLVSQAAYEKAMADRYASTKVGEDIFGNSITGYTGTGTQSRAGINAPQPTNTGGGISFTFGGGGGGGGASVPSNVLTPRQFPPYTSTYTPPAAVTPEPYNWATRDPYIYGEGLSNAGAAYDIWGSAPGTNPYLLSVPESYTQGLLGMPPVQLPDNVPSTNVGANINLRSNNNNDTTTTTTTTAAAIPRGNMVAEGVARGDPNVPFSYAVDPIAFREGRLWADIEGVPDPIKMREGSIVKTDAEIARQLAKPVTSFETKKQEARDSIQTAAAKAGGGTAKNYGVTGKRIVGGR